MLYSVYILKGQNKAVFVGLTEKDLKTRIEEHCDGEHSLIESPFSLAYSFQTKDKSEAYLKREFIKALFRSKCLTFKNSSRGGSS